MPRIAPLSCRDSGIASDARNSRIQPVPRNTMRNGVLGPFLQKPTDWSKLTLRRIDFYEPLLVTVRELVKAVKKDALILMTLYSPYMCAGQCATGPLRQHLEENPDAVKRGMEILTESQLMFVRACIQIGVDGFYTSTQGSEAKTFSRPEIFAQYVEPYDLVSMREINAACNEACARNGLQDCYVRPIAWRGAEQLSVSALHTQTHVAIAVSSTTTSSS